MTRCTDMVNLEGERSSLGSPRCLRFETYVCTGEDRKGYTVAFQTENRQSLPLVRGSSKSLPNSTMPITTSSQSLLASFPSFMSVFGEGVDPCQSKESDIAASQAATRSANTGRRPPYSTNFSSPVFRRDSASTFESTESSPTTTISTLDSSITEPSPSSSPESPISLSPLSAFKSLKAGVTSMEGEEHESNPFASVSNLNRADSPSKKMRNTKNLSVNTSASSRQAPHLPRLALSNVPGTAAGRAFSAPVTPSFIVPPKPPRKRSSNLGLTLETPDPAPTQGAPRGLGIAPPTPSDPQPRTFRFLQSASSMPTVASPTVAPEGGMRLPPFGRPSIASRLGKGRPLLGLSHSYETTTSSPITVQTLEHVQEENDYELPLSREAKSPAYPEGPVCIYEPHVYLYLEPSDTEASKFDVVLNVAREVLNPFRGLDEMDAGPSENDDAAQVSLQSRTNHFMDRESVSEPQTAISDKSFSSALEKSSNELFAIAGPSRSPKAPEYIHIPWDHNTNVVDDLLKLCELIDNRVQDGKRVLVHCQCGVSRSASLVVAYGLYKNPQLTVQEAYNAVKNRSRWIGPNMNLIYQLSEFKSKLPRTFIPGPSTWHSSRNIGSGRSNPLTTFSADLISSTPLTSLRSVQTEPTSAPFQKDQESTPARANSFSPPGPTQVVETSAVGDISPGPSSAPADMQWTTSEQAPGVTEVSKDDLLDGRNPRTLFPSRRMDIEKPSQTRTSMSAPNMTGCGSVGSRSNDRDSVEKMNLDTIEPNLIAFPPLDTTSTTTTDAELNSLSPLNSRESPRWEIESSRRSHAEFMEVDTDGQTLMPLPSAKPANIEIPLRDSDSIPGTPTKHVETAIRLPPSFTKDERNAVNATSKVPLNSATSTLPVGFSSISARRAKSSLALRQEHAKSIRPQLSLIGLNNPMFDGIPPTPSLLSPRAAEFTASPFHRTVAGDLAGSSVFEQSLVSPTAAEEDPRSPVARGEAPITRSIFDVL